MTPEDTDQAVLTLVRAVLAEDLDTLNATVISAGESGVIIELFLSTLSLSANALNTLARQRGVDIEEFLDGLALQELRDREA